MFDTLDSDTLNDMARVGERSLLKDDARRDAMLACLEQAITDCRQAGNTGTGMTFDSRQVIGGLQAAQQILTAWWRSEEPSAP